MSSSKAEQEIIELKRKLMASEQKAANLLAVFDHLPVGIEIYDEAGFARYLNQKMQEFARLSSTKHVIGCFNILTDPFSAESGIRQLFEKAYSGEVVKTPEFMIEMGRASKTWGTQEGELWCRLILIPSFDSQGLVHSVTCIVIDTQQERKMAEAITQLSRRDGIEMLAGGVAHDYQNLLTAIITNAQMLITELPANDLREMAEDVVLATQQASFLTRQLFTLTGRMKPDVRTHDLCQELEEMVQSQEPLLAEFDQGQMRQVFMNLATNAIDAMGKSKGVVTLSTTRKMLSPEERSEVFFNQEVSHVKEYVHVAVTDTGVGIHPELVCKIFDPYMTTKASGHGLGLAAALEILRNHDAGVRVESILNEGTTMNVYVPLSAQDVSLPAESFAPLSLSHSSSVLIIDDSDYVRAALRALLTRQNLDVQDANSGEEALLAYAARAIKPELVVCDLMMGAVNGFDVMREIREVFPRQKFLLMGSHYEAGEAAVRDDPYALFLKKPFDMQSFLHCINKLAHS